MAEQEQQPSDPYTDLAQTDAVPSDEEWQGQPKPEVPEDPEEAEYELGGEG
jgi:hypothetical protein